MFRATRPTNTLDRRQILDQILVSVGLFLARMCETPWPDLSPSGSFQDNRDTSDPVQHTWSMCHCSTDSFTPSTNDRSITILNDPLAVDEPLLSYYPQRFSKMHPEKCVDVNPTNEPIFSPEVNSNKPYREVSHVM